MLYHLHIWNKKARRRSDESSELWRAELHPAGLEPATPDYEPGAPKYKKEPRLLSV